MVAEQTVFLMSGLLKNVANNDRAVRQGRQIEVTMAGPDTLDHEPAQKVHTA